MVNPVSIGVTAGLGLLGGKSAKKAADAANQMNELRYQQGLSLIGNAWDTGMGTPGDPNWEQSFLAQYGPRPTGGPAGGMGLWNNPGQLAQGSAGAMWDQARARAQAAAQGTPPSLHGLLNLGYGQAESALKGSMGEITRAEGKAEGALTKGFEAALGATQAQASAGQQAIMTQGTQGLAGALQNLKGRGLAGTSAVGRAQGQVGYAQNNALAQLFAGVAGQQGALEAQRGMGLGNLATWGGGQRAQAMGNLANLYQNRVREQMGLGQSTLNFISGRADIAGPTMFQSMGGMQGAMALGNMMGGLFGGGGNPYNQAAQQAAMIGGQAALGGLGWALPG